MVYALLIFSALLGGLMTVTTKTFQKSLTLDFSNFTFYNFVNAAFGSIFLLAACSFRPQINLVTASYALLYAVVVFVSLIVNMLFLSENSVSLYSLTNTAGAIIPSALVGKKTKGFSLKQYACIGASTCLSNIISVLSAYILAGMAVSLYTILNSSLNLMIGVAVSVLLFKKKSTKENNIALLFAIAAIVLSV